MLPDGPFSTENTENTGSASAQTVHFPPAKHPSEPHLRQCIYKKYYYHGFLAKFACSRPVNRRYRSFISTKNEPMKIKENYKVREIAGEHIVVIQGTLGADMTRVISLNDTGAWLWNELTAKDFSIADVAELLCTRYEVDEATALADAGKWIHILQDCKAIEE